MRRRLLGHALFAAVVCRLDVAAGVVAPGANDTPGSPELGLHWMAPLLSGGGYASEALAFMRGLIDGGARIEVTAEQHGDSISREYISGLPLSDQAVLQEVLHRRQPPQRAIVVCHSEPGAWHLPPAHGQRYQTSRCPAPGAAYRVGRTMFETDRLPQGWLPRLQAMDEVWVPSTWSADVFAAGGLARERIVVLPEAVDVDFFSPETAYPPLVVPGRLPERTGCASDGPQRYGGSASCPVRFLAIGKWERRKNWDALLRAFLTEFALPASVAAAREGALHAQLVIVTSRYHSERPLADELAGTIRNALRCGSAASDAAAAAAGHAGGSDAAAAGPLCLPPEAADRLAAAAPIVLLDGIPQADMPRLYGAAEAFVLPSRGEGWGRPHVEAMACGRPVIATNWSGSTAFLNAGNGYPLPYTHLAPIPDGAFAGHLQAEVDVAVLRRTLRHVSEHQGEAAARGRQARHDMESGYSPRAVGALLEGHVRRISDALAARRAAKAQAGGAAGAAAADPMHGGFGARDAVRAPAPADGDSPLPPTSEGVAVRPDGSIVAAA